jgi:hypothetical protein
MPTGEEMKTIRQLFAASILTLSLTAAAVAGDMQTPGITSPPTSPLHSKAGTKLPDESSTAYDALTETALLLCHKVLSLL